MKRVRQKARGKRRERLAEPEPIAAIVERVERLERFPKREPVDEALWLLVVGKTVATRTRPVKLLLDGTLLVRTSSASWSQELSFLEPTIRAKLVEKGVRVERLRFQVGTVAAMTTPFEIARTAKANAPKPVPRALTALLATVEDDDLRKAIGGALARRLQD